MYTVINQDQFVYSIIDDNLEGVQYIFGFKVFWDCKNKKFALCHQHQ